MKNLTFTLGALLIFMFTNAQEWTSWKVTYQSDNEIFTAIDFYDHEFGAVVGEGGVIKTTDDAGQSWTDHTDASLGDLLGVDVHTNEEIYVYNQHEVYRLGGSNLTKELIFKNDDIDIKYCEKQIMPISAGEDAPYIYVGANNSQIFCSHSNGEKWFKLDWPIIDENDDVLFVNGFYRDVFEDTAFAMTLSVTGKIVTSSDFRSLSFSNKFFDNGTVKKVNNVDSHNPFYTTDKMVGVNDKGEISVCWANAQEDLDHATNTVLNDAVLISRMSSSSKAGNKWPGWAVGNNGYIAEYYAKYTGGEYKPINSPTTKNLNVIDFASEYSEQQGRLMGQGTVCIAGDGVIMMCYIDWNPIVSVNFSEKRVDVSAFPNPFTSNMHLKLNGLNADESLNIRVLNMQGQVVESYVYTSMATDSHELDLGAKLENGMYFIEIENGSSKHIQSLVKQ